MTILNEDYQLNNGVKIPKLALGTWLLDDDAAEKAVTAALQLGLLPLPKTANPDHMKQNADVDFVIGADDLETMKHLEHIKDYGKDGFFPVYGGKI